MTKNSRLNRFKSWLWLWGGLSMLALLPLLTDFLRNRYQVSIQDLLLPLFLNLLTALIVALIFARRWRLNPVGAYLAGILVTVTLTNGYDGRLQAIYPLFQSLSPFPGLGDNEGLIFSLIFILLIIMLAAWLGRRIALWLVPRRVPERDAVIGLTLAVGIAFLFQFLPTARDLAVEWPQFFFKPAPLPAAQAASVSNKPDIYYIVLDRYASQSVLKTQFSYDNADFMNFLQSEQFMVNPTAHNNFPYTTMSIASTLNAGYQPDLNNRFSQAPQQTIIPYHNSIRYSSVVRRLKSLGYSYTHIGSWYDATNQAPLADNYYQPDGKLTVLGQTFTLDNMTQAQLSGSIYWRLLSAPVLKPVAQYAGKTSLEMDQYSIDTLKRVADQTGGGGHFVFAHILVPHDPYFFNADGSISQTSDSNDNGEPIKQKYLGQVEFINSQMKGILNHINDNSHGQAVVVLQADEGPYPIQLNDKQFNQAAADEEINSLDMRTWPDLDLQMKFGNLAAYHIPAASQKDLQGGADSANVFRLIFNSYFGDNLPYLPRCYYAYPNGRAKSLVYTDITQRLTGQTNPACPASGVVQQR